MEGEPEGRRAAGGGAPSGAPLEERGQGPAGSWGGGFTFVLRLEVEMVCHRSEVRP